MDLHGLQVEARYRKDDYEGRASRARQLRSIRSQRRPRPPRRYSLVASALTGMAALDRLWRRAGRRPEEGSVAP